MQDPFQDINRMRELELLVSPIPSRQQRYIGFEHDSYLNESNIQSDGEDSLSFHSDDEHSKKSNSQQLQQEIPKTNQTQIPIDNPKYTDNNTVSISEKTKAEEKTVETVSLIKDPNNSNNYCFFCHGTDDIVKCYGGCDRYFHLHCLGAKRKKDMKKWKCRECSGGELKSSTFHKKHCLRNWYFKDVVELVDGSHSVIIEGTLCYDESTWKCSPIDHLIDKTHVVTINHSIYTLIGVMNTQKSIENGFSDVACQTCLHGLPPNWRDELKCIAPVQGVLSNEQSCIAPEFKKISKPKPKRIPKEQEMESPVTVIPLTNETTTNGQPVRRSGRIRIPPLPFWKNEYLRINEKTGTTELIMGSSNKSLPKAVKSSVKGDFPDSIIEEEPVVFNPPSANTSMIQPGDNDTTFVETSFEKSDEETVTQLDPSGDKTILSSSSSSEPDETVYNSGMDFEEISDEADFFDDQPLTSVHKKKEKVKKQQNKQPSIHLSWSGEEIEQLRRIAEEGSSSTNKEAYSDMSRRLRKSIEECKAACRFYHIKIIKHKKGPAPIIPQLNQALARKGTLKRKRQIRELLDVIDKEDTVKKETNAFENRTLNADWEAAFRTKTPSIAQKKPEVLNASFLETSQLFEQLDDSEKDRVVLSAEKIGKRKKVKKGPSVVRPIDKDISKSSRGAVVGYISEHGVPVVEVHRKEDDLDDMANTSFSDSLLDDE